MEICIRYYLVFDSKGVKLVLYGQFNFSYLILSRLQWQQTVRFPNCLYTMNRSKVLRPIKLLCAWILFIQNVLIPTHIMMTYHKIRYEAAKLFYEDLYN